MKKLNINLKLVAFIAIPLFVLILLQSILEYRSGRQAIVDLMTRQSEALIKSIARAGEKGIIAYEYQQRGILNQLLSFAAFLDRFEKQGRPLNSVLLGLFKGGEIKMAVFLDGNGKIVRNLLPAGGEPGIAAYMDKLAPLLNKKTDNVVLGIINSPTGNKYFAAAAGRSSGGAIVVAIGAEELLSLRRSFGAGSVIDYLSESPGVMYAGIVSNGAILAASKNFPRVIDEAWYSDTTNIDNGIKTRFIKKATPEGDDIFEAAGAFLVGEKLLGEIVVGFSTTQLDLVAAGLKRNIFWRSILFLIIAVGALAAALVGQNYRLLTDKYEEIRAEVQKLEADRAASEKLTAMGELAKGVAHEIRNPLNAIRVIIQRLQREFSPASDQNEYKKLTEIIQKETDRINQTVKDFLDLSRPPHLNKAKGDLSTCLNETMELFKPRAAAKGCDIQIDFQPIPAVCFDKDLCKQAILNLLENSLAAVGNTGMIQISARAGEGKAIVDIEDNGPGIPNDLKSRVFDLYYTTKDTGTGMGLPTVLRIVKEHGGRIELMDSPLGGAHFRLELPIE